MHRKWHTSAGSAMLADQRDGVVDVGVEAQKTRQTRPFFKVIDGRLECHVISGADSTEDITTIWSPESSKVSILY
jgi:hypothetical protein